MLRYLTAGESHGKGLTAVVEGMPSGLSLSEESVNADLARRQVGYGRGGRMAIEKDRVEITAGVRHGVTLGSPIAMTVRNRDWENWRVAMAVGGVGDADEEQLRRVTRPRPGHADLAGAMKYATADVRNILERSSARETAARVAVGAAAKALVRRFGMDVVSWVVEIGGVRWEARRARSPHALYRAAERSDVRCPDRAVSALMRRRIDEAREAGDSLGGAFEVVVTGVPPGLGSHVHWDRRLDGRLAQALMSVQATKAVEVGMGFAVSSTPGSKVHDEIFFSARRAGRGDGYWPVGRGYYRRTNNAGGIEGGMTNGEPIVLRAAMKPIPTLYRPLRSVDMATKRPFKASIERSDTCAVAAAAVVAEAAAAFTVACAFLEKFGGDSVEEIDYNYRGYLDRIVRDFS